MILAELHYVDQLHRDEYQTQQAGVSRINGLGMSGARRAGEPSNGSRCAQNPLCDKNLDFLATQSWTRKNYCDVNER